NGPVPTPMLCVKLASTVETLLQLSLIEPPGFIDKRDEGLLLRFHLFTQYFRRKMRVAFETHQCDRAFDAFIYRVNHTRSATLLIDRFNPELHIYIVETSCLILLDDFLP